MEMFEAEYILLSSEVFLFQFFPPLNIPFSNCIHVQSALIVVMLMFGFVSEDQPHFSVLPIPSSMPKTFL